MRMSITSGGALAVAEWLAAEHSLLMDREQPDRQTKGHSMS